MSDHLALALDALSSGLVVGVPTDTVYGIGADPFDSDAVARLFEIKGRAPEKPIAILVADLDQARRIGIVVGEVADVAREHWPGPLTLVVKRAPGLPFWIGDATLGSVGVRVPDHPAALDLLSGFGPLAVTSANPTGEPPAPDDVTAREMLGDAVAVYIPGKGFDRSASTVVDVTGPAPMVLRHGPIDWEQA